MFLALQLYGHDGSEAIESGWLAVVDFDDGSVEKINLKDIKNSGVKIRNINFWGEVIDKSMSLLYHIGNDERNKSYVISIDKNGLRYKSWRLTFRKESYISKINGKKMRHQVPIDLTQLMYAFEFRGRLILRFLGLRTNEWYSIALDRNGDCITWDIEMKRVIGDKGFAVQVDTLSEV